MKKILIPFLLFAGIVGYLSCQKEYSSDPVADRSGNSNARIATDSSHCDSTRTDTCCTCGILKDTTFRLTGDQIRIEPVKIDSGNLSGLYIKASTVNTYPCANVTLTTTFIPHTAGYTFGFFGAHVNGYCIGGQNTAQSNTTIFPIRDSTYTFTVVFNNAVYYGSFTKTGNQYNFTWPYNSGVTISPTTLN